MGFWAWLLGYEKKEDLDENIGNIQPQNLDINIEKAEPEIVKKPLYKPRPMSKEDIAFVQEMNVKAKSPDPKIVPFIDKTNPKDIERITNELKDKLAKRR